MYLNCTLKLQYSVWWNNGWPIVEDLQLFAVSSLKPFWLQHSCPWDPTLTSNSSEHHQPQTILSSPSIRTTVILSGSFTLYELNLTRTLTLNFSLVWFLNINQPQPLSLSRPFLFIFLLYTWLHSLNNILDFSFKKIIYFQFYLEARDIERQRQREIFYPLVLSPNAQRKPETLSRSSKWVAGSHVLEPSYGTSQEHLQEVGLEVKVDMTPGTPICDAGIPSSSFTLCITMPAMAQIKRTDITKC